MFLQLMWFIMMGAPLAFSVINGNAREMLPAALEGAEQAVALTIRLGAGYMFFGGLMEIAREAGAAGWLERLLRPVWRRLMPNAQSAEIREAVTISLSMNLLGAGNAATPAGIEAVRLMDRGGRAMRQDLYMFLILNATGLQLVPTSVLTLRAAAGSADVNAVIIPTLLCTAAATLIGLAAGFCCRRWEEAHA